MDFPHVGVVSKGTGMTCSKTRRSSGDDCSRSSLVIRRAYCVEGERSVSIPSKMRLFMALAPVLAFPSPCYQILVQASCVSRDGAKGHHQRAAMRTWSHPRLSGVLGSEARPP